MRLVIGLSLLLLSVGLSVQQGFQDTLPRGNRSKAFASMADYLYRGKVPFKVEDRCGTSFSKVLRRRRERAGKGKKGKCFSSSFLDDPTCYGLDQSLDTTHFTLWYTTSGSHAVNTEDIQPANGVPDYIDNAATIAEKSYDFIVNTLGYKKPPTTTLHPRTYIYFINTGAFGYTDYAAYEGDAEGPSALVAIHHTMIGLRDNEDPDGTILGALRVTIAHEFFHAVKASYDWNEDTNYGFWWDEATSTWIEDELYPKVNDYLWYLCYSFADCSGWLARPSTSLNSPSPGLHRYGGSLFAKFLTETHQHFANFNRSIIRETWECAAKVQGGNSLECIDSTLQNHASSLAKTYAQFMQAVYLKDFIDGGNPKFENVVIPSDTTLDHMSSTYVVPSSAVSNAQIVADPFETAFAPFGGGSIATDSTAALFSFSGAPSCAFSETSGAQFKAISISNITLSTDSLPFDVIAGTASSLAAPANLSGTVAQTTGYIQLSWDSVPQASSYAVYRSDDKTTFSLLKENIAGTAFTDSQLASGTTYYYFVRAQDNSGKVGCPSRITSSKAMTADAVVKSRPFPLPNPVTSGSDLKLKIDVGSSFGKTSGTEPVQIKFLSSGGKTLRNSSSVCSILDGMLTCTVKNVNFPNGLYFFSMEMDTVLGKVRKVGKFIVLR